MRFAIEAVRRGFSLSGAIAAMMDEKGKRREKKRGEGERVVVVKQREGDLWVGVEETFLRRDSRLRVRDDGESGGIRAVEG